MPRLATLAVGPDAIGLVGASKAVSEMKVAPFERGDSTSLRSALRLVLEGAGTAQVEVIIADCMLKFFVVDPPAGLTRFSDLEATATVVFEDLFGLDTADWRLSADWDARRRFVASAAPRWLISALDETGKVRIVEPAYVRACNALPRGEMPQWFVCRLPNSVTAANFEGGACQVVRSSMLLTDEPVVPWLEREALLANRPLNRATLMSSASSDRGTGPSTFEKQMIAPPHCLQALYALRSPAMAVP